MRCSSRTFRLAAVVCGLLAVLTGYSVAADVIDPASQRYQAESLSETPDFQRHIVPLLGQIGCNGRSCHGSFQGQGNFRLSLFGYDFHLDHEQIKTRIDQAQPLNSLFLTKPASTDDHGGGQKLVPGTWQYKMVARWLEAGAAPRGDKAADLVRLEVTPSSIQFRAGSKPVPLNVIAVWDDGTREDVTCLSRFQTNDSSVAEVSPSGIVTQAGVGDSHVVVYYDNGIVPIPVVQPYSEQAGDRYPQLQARTDLDRHVLNKLSTLGVIPSELCTDEEFLRRLSLDLAGTLPSAEEVTSFLEDTRPDKRDRKIDELLETDAYASRWTLFFSDLTGNSQAKLPGGGGSERSPNQEWFDWLEQRIRMNVPYDKIVEGIVLAVSRRPGETYQEFCVRMANRNGRFSTTTYAEQPHLTYYWARNNFQDANERALGFAYTFMGIRLQCAECHKHPFDEWTQEDFNQFKVFFDRVRFTGGSPVNLRSNPIDAADHKRIVDALDLPDDRFDPLPRQNRLSEMTAMGYVVPASELAILDAHEFVRPIVNKKSETAGKGTKVARLLRGHENFVISEMNEPRQPLMDWLRQPENRLLARSLVNRVWGQYFHRGIVEPTDDLSLANPPSNEALLDYLERGFVENGYDLKWLHRTITRSDTYQRSWRTNETNRLEVRNFSRAVPRRLSAEILLDAVDRATADSTTGLNSLSRTAGRKIARSTVGGDYALQIFGQPLRETNCDCERVGDPSLLQLVYLRNDNDLYQKIERPDGWINEVRSRLNKQRPSVTPPKRAVAKTSAPRSTEKEEDEYEKEVAQLTAAIKAANAAGNAKEARLLSVRLSSTLRRIATRKQSQDAETDSAPGTPVKDVSPKPTTPEGIIQEAYLRTLTRKPTVEEAAIALEAIQQAKDPVQGYAELLWVLLNTKEFFVNH